MAGDVLLVSRDAYDALWRERNEARANLTAAMRERDDARETLTMIAAAAGVSSESPIGERSIVVAVHKMRVDLEDVRAQLAAHQARVKKVVKEMRERAEKTQLRSDFAALDESAAWLEAADMLEKVKR